jgi:hypothetical protein
MTRLPDAKVRRARHGRWWHRRAAWLYDGLCAGELTDHREHADEGPMPVTLHQLGRMVFPLGQLVVADPYLLGAHPRPIAQTLRDTPYDVVAADLEITLGHHRTAAGILVGGDGPVVSWEYARCAGARPGLRWDSYLGYGVDSGVGCFVGVPAAKRIGPVLEADDGRLQDRLSRTLFGEEEPVGLVVEVVAGMPLAAFPSGWGDGCYPTWLGLDAAGEVVVVVTDFMVVTDPYLARRGARGRGRHLW